MDIMQIINWIVQNKEEMVAVYLSFVGAASIIVKMTPTLKDDHVLKNIIKFVGKFIALNRK